MVKYRDDLRILKFGDNIQTYNSIFSFTSIGGMVDNNINNGTDPFIFKIGGQNHHKIGSLLPGNNCKPKFAQFNSLGSMGRNTNNSSLDPNIVDGVLKIIRHKDQRQHNLPTTSKVFALQVSQKLCKMLQRNIKVVCTKYMSYTQGAKSTSSKRTKLTQRQCYAYSLQDRENEGHTLIDSGRLTQQFMCNAFTYNQPKLRAYILQGLEGAVVRGDISPSFARKRIIFHSSITDISKYTTIFFYYCILEY
ncbi:DNA helicase PIF1, ATP-dependent [Gossypium australe]|uniref:DNA helicase PIF1, ATP-dependent n=1 Tax=Gossypium australe TaxID=47621 RepID=A0A5B6UQK6_9ROSI|nr:DNA helicase PIF1, ATP-dependent [Gossypium australe]